MHVHCGRVCTRFGFRGSGSGSDGDARYHDPEQRVVSKQGNRGLPGPFARQSLQDWAHPFTGLPLPCTGFPPPPPTPVYSHLFRPSGLPTRTLTMIMLEGTMNSE